MKTENKTIAVKKGFVREKILISLFKKRYTDYEWIHLSAAEPLSLFDAEATNGNITKLFEFRWRYRDGITWLRQNKLWVNKDKYVFAQEKLKHGVISYIAYVIEGHGVYVCPLIEQALNKYKPDDVSFRRGGDSRMDLPVKNLAMFKKAFSFEYYLSVCQILKNKGILPSYMDEHKYLT